MTDVASGSANAKNNKHKCYFLSWCVALLRLQAVWGSDPKRRRTTDRTRQHRTHTHTHTHTQSDCHVSACSSAMNQQHRVMERSTRGRTKTTRGRKTSRETVCGEIQLLHLFALYLRCYVIRDNQFRRLFVFEMILLS